MFEYDPPAAARLLATLEPFLASTAVREAVPDRPEARLARIRQLQRVGRKEEANVGLDQALERWPEELAIRGMAAERAYVDRNWRELARLLPTDEVYPDTFDSAPLYIYRSRTRASADDADGARADLDRAVELGGHRPWILNMVGDAWLEMERPELARGIWTRAMHASASESAELRAASTRRLARLAETQGQAGTALRLWRDVIELIPEDEEASRRIARLEIDR
jgi:tetratricopeptide (TPR) repeat protein